MLGVFLSYHTPDRAIALSLKRAIEDTLRGANVFVDQTHLRYGHLWQPSLFDAIAKAQAFLILVSHRAGDWQKFEYYEALDRKVKNNAFVLLPVIIADRPMRPLRDRRRRSRSQHQQRPLRTALHRAAVERRPGRPQRQVRGVAPFHG